jgi:hypothetical protein
VVVRLVNAKIMMGMAGMGEIEAIRALGEDAGARLERVAIKLEDAAPLRG